MKENNNEYLDLFFNCSEHRSKRERLDGIFTRLKQDERGQFKEDLQGIIDFVNGTDRDVEDYVKELKAGI